jgi:hypothetical protein
MVSGVRAHLTSCAAAHTRSLQGTVPVTKYSSKDISVSVADMLDWNYHGSKNKYFAHFWNENISKYKVGCIIYL